MKNNKGFTLIELLAVITLLALVMGVGAYSIISILDKQKENDYKLLLSNIKDAAETYFEECKYSQTIDNCQLDNVSLNELITFGYLKGNSSDKETIINPKDKKNIGTCKIKILDEDGVISIISVNQIGSCPTSY